MADMAAAITIGPHVSAMDPAAMQQLQQEMAEKVKKGQCWVILWDDIKHNPPEQLKISRIVMIPHKPRLF